MRVVAATLILALVVPVPALASELAGPRDVVRAGVERLVGLVDAPKSAHAGDTRAISEAEASLFDLEEMARRTLSRHWSARDAGERSEAVSLVGRLLGNSFVRRIALGAHPAEYQQVVDGDYATVLSREPGRPAREAVEYRLYRKDGRWRVYDVVADGFSFVALYRAEFDRLMRSASFRGLFETLRRSLDSARVEPPPGEAKRSAALILLPAFLEQASRRR